MSGVDVEYLEREVETESLTARPPLTLRHPDEILAMRFDDSDIILGDRELQLLAGSFRSVEAKPMNLLAMAKRLFRGRFQSPVVRGVLRCLESADDRVLRWFPSLGRYCGEILVVAEK